MEREYLHTFPIVHAAESLTQANIPITFVEHLGYTFPQHFMPPLRISTRCSYDTSHGSIIPPKRFNYG